MFAGSAYPGPLLRPSDRRSQNPFGAVGGRRSRGRRWLGPVLSGAWPTFQGITCCNKCFQHLNNPALPFLVWYLRLWQLTS